MPFQDYEVSVAGGEPVELYSFGYQGGTLRFTSAQKDVDYASNTYTAVPGLARSSIQDTGEIDKSDLEITAPIDFLVSGIFEVYPPSDVVDLTITRVHLGDLSDGKIIWLGRVLSVEWGIGYSKLRCESLFTQMRQPGLRRAYSRNCPHLLYGFKCGASALANVVSLVVTAIDSTGFEITATPADSYDDGFFSGGKLEFEPTPGIILRRGIRKHLGEVLTLTHPIPELIGGAIVAAYPGCDKTITTCNDKFSNLANFGGFPNMTSRNPFGQSSVF